MLLSVNLLQPSTCRSWDILAKKGSEGSISDPEFGIAKSLVEEIQNNADTSSPKFTQKSGANTELTFLSSDLISESLQLSTEIPKPFLNSAPIINRKLSESSVRNFKTAYLKEIHTKTQTRIHVTLSWRNYNQINAAENFFLAQSLTRKCRHLLTIFAFRVVLLIQPLLWLQAEALC